MAAILIRKRRRCFDDYGTGVYEEVFENLSDEELEERELLMAVLSEPDDEE